MENRKFLKILPGGVQSWVLGQKENLSKTQLVNSVQPWISGIKFLIMNNHFPKSQDSTPSGSIVKNILFSRTVPFALKMIYNRILAKLSL